MCCKLLCGCRQLNYGIKHIETIFLCVSVYIFSLLHRLFCLSLQFSLYHPCFCGAFQSKHSWKLNTHSSDLIVFGDVEMAVFNYQCLKPSSVVARFWRNESGQATKALISGERLISIESILNSVTIGSFLDVMLLMCSLFCLTDDFQPLILLV